MPPEKAPALTEQEKAGWPQETVVALEAPFVDDRGTIQPILETVMRSALVIHSKKGAIRANHFHKSDWHYCYVLSGSMEHFQRPTGSTAKAERFVVKTGQMVFTPPMMEHANRFLEDTTLLVLSRNPRDQNAYEHDVVRTELID